jgi:hypothetical protein
MPSTPDVTDNSYVYYGLKGWVVISRQTGFNIRVTLEIVENSEVAVARHFAYPRHNVYSAFVATQKEIIEWVTKRYS